MTCARWCSQSSNVFFGGGIRCCCNGYFSCPQRLNIIGSQTLFVRVRKMHWHMWRTDIQWACGLPSYTPHSEARERESLHTWSEREALLQFCSYSQPRFSAQSSSLEISLRLFECSQWRTSLEVENIISKLVSFQLSSAQVDQVLWSQKQTFV